MINLRVIYFAFGLFVIMSCTDERQIQSELLRDCTNHYQATSYLVAMTTCQKAATKGIAQAQWLLGHIHFYDLAGQGAQPEIAFSWYLQAAESGMTEAQTLVGGFYLNADGVEEDFGKAYEWLIKAAKSGDPEAEFSIGMIYIGGKGRQKDTSAAISWFRKAANKHHLMSINNLAWIHATSTQKAYRSAKKAKYWADKLQLDETNRSVFLDTRAAAYAVAGEFEQAIQAQNDAIASLPEDVIESRLVEFQKRLETYQSHQSWQE